MHSAQDAVCIVLSMVALYVLSQRSGASSATTWYFSSAQGADNYAQPGCKRVHAEVLPPFRGSAFWRYNLTGRALCFCAVVAISCICISHQHREHWKAELAVKSRCHWQFALCASDLDCCRIASIIAIWPRLSLQPSINNNRA
jgi:hypothetical protein